MGRTRRKFSSEEKLKMVMAVIQDGKAVSDVAQENNVHPNMILNWKKEFLENAAAVFDRHRPDITEKAQQLKCRKSMRKLKSRFQYLSLLQEFLKVPGMNGSRGKELRQGIITKRRNSTGIRRKMYVTNFQKTILV